MKLQTQIPLSENSKNVIDYHSKILLIGSCFSENIGDKFKYYKLDSLQNPFGILFNPKAIEAVLVNAINKKTFLDDAVFFHNEQWHCFDAHSKLSAPSKEILLSNLNHAIAIAHKKLMKATHLVITLGTAWIYRFLESNTIVANCHKLPQNQFKKELLSIDTIENSLRFIIDLIRFKNPNITIIFTVSPVRHLKHGFVENTRSKSHLLTAVHSVISQTRGLFYFPSYEIMMDELRDYRFYDSDMIHPNQLAMDYIWEKFTQVWLCKDTLKIMDEVDSIQKDLLHKPFNEDSHAHQKFLENLELKKKNIAKKYPHITF